MAKDAHQIRCRILPVVWERARFGQHRRSITSYARELIERNFMKGIDVDRDDVVHHWWLLVDRVFSKGDPDREKYISQVCRVSQPYS